VQFGNSAERITVLDVILRLPLCAQFQTDAVNAFNPHTIAMKNGWLLGCRGLRFGKRRELGVCDVGRALRQIERAGKDLHGRRLRTGPDHRPVSRRYRKPHLVAGGKYRACIIELDAHAVAIICCQQRGLFVALAMREVEHTIADAQRFTGGGHIAQPDHQTGNWPVGRDIERDRRSAKDLDRRFEWRRLESQRAGIVFLLVASLITSATEWDPLPRKLAKRLRRTHGPSRQRPAWLSKSRVG